jgi:hypothetical protein
MGRWMKSEENVGTNSQVIANNRGGVESIKVASPYHGFGVHYVRPCIRPAESSWFIRRLYALERAIDHEKVRITSGFSWV